MIIKVVPQYNQSLFVCDYEEASISSLCVLCSVINVLDLFQVNAMAFCWTLDGIWKNLMAEKICSMKIKKAKDKDV